MAAEHEAAAAGHGKQEGEEEATRGELEAAITRKDVAAVCSWLRRRHSHMLPLAPYRTSHRRKVARFVEEMEAAMSATGQTVEQLQQFGLQVLSGIVASAALNTAVGQFGNVASCWLAAVARASAGRQVPRPQAVRQINEWLSASELALQCLLDAIDAFAVPVEAIDVKAVRSRVGKAAGMPDAAPLCELLLSKVPAAVDVLPADTVATLLHTLVSVCQDDAAALRFVALCVASRARGVQGPCSALARALAALHAFDFVAHVLRRHEALSGWYPELHCSHLKDLVTQQLAAKRYDAAVATAQQTGLSEATRHALARHVVQQAAKSQPLLSRTLAATLQLSRAEVEALCPMPKARASAAGATGTPPTAGSGYLSLELPLDRVFMVNTLTACKSMEDSLRREYHRVCRLEDDDSKRDGAELLVGVDAEWRPVFNGGATTYPRPALLQLATATQAFLVDLLAVASSAALQSRLDATLSWLFTQRDVLPVGFALDGDVGHLQRTFPTMRCFRALTRVLDIRAVAADGVVQARVGSGRWTGRGLSAACSVLLGGQLDKSAQLSDWEARPLHASQIRYAAQDAHMLVRLAHTLARSVGMDHLRRLCGTPTHTAPAGAAPSSAADNAPTCATPTWALFPHHDELHVRFHLYAAALRAGQRRPPKRGLATVSSAAKSESVAVRHTVWPPFTAARVAPLPTATHPVLEYVRSRGSALGIEGGGCAVHVETAAEGVGGDWRWASQAGMRTIATALRMEEGAVAKSVAFLHAGRGVLVVASAGDRIDYAALNTLLSRGDGSDAASTRGARTATEAECKTRFGFQPGSIPPLCLQLRPAEAGIVIVDANLAEHERIAVGVGSPSTFLVTTPAALVALADATVAAVAASPVAEAASTPASDQLPRFLADATIGKLVKWLRLLGVDTEVGPSNMGPGTLLQLAKDQSRLLLTRRRKTMQRKLAKTWCHVIEVNGGIHKQLEELGDSFPAIQARREQLRARARTDGASSHAPFSRCAKCNGPGFRDLTREEVKGRVPEYTQRTAPHFQECVRCKQVFWPGAIYDAAKRHT